MQQQPHQNHHHQQQQQLYERLDTAHVLKPPQPPKKRSFLPIFDEQNIEIGQKMQQEKASSSRLGAKPTGGVIVEVQGGHIVRSTGRKDRHSKVCTAKGPRDRRVRLSAHTAIQFYDVQDRLGYDRPSKAVDWLIKKAKASIDGLAELPAWTPSTSCIQTNSLAAEISSNEIQHHQQQQEQIHRACNNVNTRDDSSRGFLPPSLDSDSIADTIKSFFPMDAAANNGSVDVSSSASNAMQHFQNYSNQDLRLSLQSFQDPMLIHQHSHGHGHNHQGGDEHSGFFSGGNPLGFDPHSAGWAEQHQPAEMNRFQRMIAWNSGHNTGHDAGSGSGYLFDTPQSPPHQQQQHNQQPFLQQLFGQPQQSQYFSQQRGPLQSSNTSSIRAWIDSPMTTDQSGGYDFSGFRIPARIQGEEDHEDGNYHHNKLPSSASSDSRH